ncbi:MAG: HIT family protein [Promethearchaeota archaeon]|jgi:histidine triad (HIT) family protein
MNETDCIFCKIINREIPSKIVFENDLNLAFLDISPISKGHTIIIPKNHYFTLEDIPDHELAETIKLVKKISMRIYQILQIDGYNILQNNFTAAGQVINHFHIHIIPRSFDDDKFRVKIPRNQASDEELNEILIKLKF